MKHILEVGRAKITIEQEGDDLFLLGVLGSCDPKDWWRISGALILVANGEDVAEDLASTDNALRGFDSARINHEFPHPRAAAVVIIGESLTVRFSVDWRHLNLRVEVKGQHASRHELKTLGAIIEMMVEAIMKHPLQIATVSDIRKVVDQAWRRGVK